MKVSIKSTKDIEINAVKCVVYGGAGVGKTRLCATAPTPLIISAESGLLSLADVDCDYVNVDSIDEFNDAYRFVKSSEEASKYETICLDSLSEIAEALVEKILPTVKDPRQAYSQLANAMLPVLRNFRRLPQKHTLFTSKMITVTDEETEKVTQELMLPGRVLPNQVPYMVDELFKLKIDRKGNQVLQTSPDRLSFCKDRSGALGKEIVNPNMTSIINEIMKKSGSKSG